MLKKLLCVVSLSYCCSAALASGNLCGSFTGTSAIYKCGDYNVKFTFTSTLPPWMNVDSPQAQVWGIANGKNDQNSSRLVLVADTAYQLVCDYKTGKITLNTIPCN